ncbi:sensor histidine kinase [Nocardia sp. NPDC048505]|uniref:sensor histidine kinase n=1 Tax=unclassified Nocardia TaxID=2637762 RepID=UPI0033F2A40A
MDEVFEHPALFYRGPAEYVRETVGFLRAGLAAGEPVAAAVPGPNLALIEAGLGRDAPDVLLLDMTEAGRNPGRIIAKVLHGFADAHPGRRVRIIGEPIWAGRTALEYPACAQHEALINAAFAGRAMTILCPYDQSRLAPRVLADARITHPDIMDAGRREVSADYDWQAVVDRYNEPLTAPPQARTFAFAAPELRAVRHFAVERAAGLGLAGSRLQDAELAVEELAANSVVHGGGSGTFAIWAEAGQVVCQVRDHGTMPDPLAGRRPAAPGQLGGRGLLLVHYIADLVRVHTSAAGTTIRCYLDIGN